MAVAQLRSTAAPYYYSTRLYWWWGYSFSGITGEAVL